MPLHSPYFFIKQKDEGGYIICYNRNRSYPSIETQDINEKEYDLITLAIEEGKRQKAKEITQALGVAR